MRRERDRGSEDRYRLGRFELGCDWCGRWADSAPWPFRWVTVNVIFGDPEWGRRVGQVGYYAEPPRCESREFCSHLCRDLWTAEQMEKPLRAPTWRPGLRAWLAEIGTWIARRRRELGA